VSDVWWVTQVIDKYAEAEGIDPEPLKAALREASQAMFNARHELLDVVRIDTTPDGQLLVVQRDGTETLVTFVMIDGPGHALVIRKGDV
jgi:hypothetical protein